MTVPVRVLALWSPDWPVTAAARAAHVAAHRPAAVFVAGRVLACSAVARAQGVRRGLRRREAQARCPDLAVLAPDTDRDARAFEPVVAAVEELAPGVEVVRPGLVVLPARGPVGWFGGEQAAAERLVDQVAARTGAEVQAGFADGLFAAVLAARRGLAVAPGDTRAFLAPLDVGELDREPDMDRSALVDLLRRLGLRSLGAFAALSAQDVASRFGADAVLCHRLARGLDPRPPVRRCPPEELSVELDLDPPIDRVDAAAFAARGLAERLHAVLAGHGLACTRLGVVARTVGGEELHRVWRCAEPLTPAGTVDRVRWQLDAWLVRGGAGAVRALRLVPEETVTAGALQLGLWGEIGEADERAGRALVRVQALLGPQAVVTAVLGGGRDPAERVRLVPWGDDRGESAPPAGGRTATARPATPRTATPRTATPRTATPRAGAVAGHPSRRAPGRTAGEEPSAEVAAAAPAGWPEDVRLRAGLASAADLLGGSELDGTAAGGPPDPAPLAPGGRADPGAPPLPRPGSARPGAGAHPSPTGPEPGRPPGVPPPRSRRRRSPAHRSPARSVPRDPPPAWPGRLPAPSPATVPPEPLPAQLTDAAGAPVGLAALDLLTAEPHLLAVDGARPVPVREWAGPWPLWQRWWVPGVRPSARLQVVLDDGTALLLAAARERWWVTGLYD